MIVEPCTKKDDYTLTWEDVRKHEGVYRQSANKRGFVIVLGPSTFSQEYCAAWFCGNTLTAYEGPKDHTDIRFWRLSAAVCISVGCE